MLRAVAQRVVLLLAAALLGTLAAAAPTHGLEVYVSPSGSDERGVGSATAPFASIDRAVAALPSAGGGQVLLLNGTFALEQPVRITANETAGMRQLSIRAAHSGAASLSGGVRIAGWKPEAAPAAAGHTAAHVPALVPGCSGPRLRGGARVRLHRWAGAHASVAPTAAAGGSPLSARLLVERQRLCPQQPFHRAAVARRV